MVTVLSAILPVARLLLLRTANEHHDSRNSREVLLKPSLAKFDKANKKDHGRPWRRGVGIGYEQKAQEEKGESLRDPRH